MTNEKSKHTETYGHVHKAKIIYLNLHTSEHTLLYYTIYILRTILNTYILIYPVSQIHLTRALIHFLHILLYNEILNKQSINTVRCPLGTHIDTLHILVKL